MASALIAQKEQQVPCLSQRRPFVPQKAEPVSIHCVLPIIATFPTHTGHAGQGLRSLFISVVQKPASAGSLIVRTSAAGTQACRHEGGWQNSNRPLWAAQTVGKILYTGMS